MSEARRQVVAVVGGGIAGLAAAWELVNRAEADRPEVHVLEGAARVGGMMMATEFAGRTVDLAADAFLARRPEAVELCEELGITDQLVPVGASGASILARGKLRAMPGGLALGIPTRWLPLARSGILSPSELLRVGTDLFRPHLGTGSAFGDRSVGAIVGERLGRPVVERLADPLIGGIHAGQADELSAAAIFPVLIAASHQSGSFMRRLGRTQAARAVTPSDASPGGPLFWSLQDATASLVDRLILQLVERGVSVWRHSPGPATGARDAGASGSAAPATRPTPPSTPTGWCWRCRPVRPPFSLPSTHPLRRECSARWSRHRWPPSRCRCGRRPLPHRSEAPDSWYPGPPPSTVDRH